MATIRQRGKYWEAQVRRSGYPTCSRTFDLKSDARAWASIIESEMERGVFIDRTEAEKNTFGDLIERYMREVSIHKKGMQSECYRLKSLLRDPISKVKMSALSSRMMAEWRDRRLKKVSSGTTNRDLSLISHVINVARKEWGIHTDNPIAMIRRPPESRGRNRRLVADEEQRLYAALTIPPRDEKGRHTGPSNPWMLTAAAT